MNLVVAMQVQTLQMMENTLLLSFSEGLVVFSGFGF